MGGRLLYAGLGGFATGVGVRSFFPATVEYETSPLGSPFVFALFLFFVGTILLCVALLRRRKNRPCARTIVVALAICAAAAGVARFDSANPHQQHALLEARIEQRIVARGVVVDEPDRRESHTKLVVELHSAERYEPIRGRVLITADSYPLFSYGDEVDIIGVLKKPELFETEDDVFDYPAFLAKDDIFYQMFFPDIAFVSRGNGNAIQEKLFALKNAWLQSVERVIPDPHVSLLGGLVVGAKRSLGEKLLDDFRVTGIIHIVVLSGYNVTIVAEAIMRFLSFLRTSLRTTIGAISIVCFALLVGGGATVVRASIMAILVLIARATNRVYAMTRALCIAGGAMVLHNPNILVFDASFQLSFAATLGLILLAPKLEEYFGWMPTSWQLREFATATIATQLFVMPMILYKMGDWSLVAFPVNMLILAVVPLTMLFGFLTGVVGFASATLSLPLAYATYTLLEYQLSVVHLFASLPFASLHISSFPLLFTVIAYAAFAAFLWFSHAKLDSEIQNR